VILISVAAVALAAPVWTPASASASTATPRIDLKVLLLGTSTTQADLPAWQAALQREGVPFDTMIVSSSTSITPATLSTTASDGTPEGKYEAVIFAQSGTGMPQASLDAIEQYEKAFNVRQVTSNAYPSATYGLNPPTVLPVSAVATLTTDGQAVFPYLAGSVPIDPSAYGYAATPISTSNFKTLLSYNGSSLVGIYTHPDGVQELVETFDQNQYMMQSWLLRHGVIAWATRGVYFGDQRNYLETDIDDMFNADDSWDAANRTNDLAPIMASGSDITGAAAWSAANHFRLDNAYNGGGDNTALTSTFTGTDPATGKPYTDSFGWINHTFDHPNIDDGCATQTYIQNEIATNLSWANTNLGLTLTTDPSQVSGYVDSGAVITGEHSGLANLAPGNPGTVDTPALSGAVAATTTGGTLAAGTYEYAITDQFLSTGGESAASAVSAQVTVPNAENSVTLTFPAVCHAADYRVYRGVVDTTTQAVTWTELPAWSPAAGTSFGDNGPNDLTYTDTGTGGTAVSTLPTTDNALEGPYDQNPFLPAAFAAEGIKAFGADASKPYPDPATVTFSPQAAGTTYAGATDVAGATFSEPNTSAQAVPRYPTNIYYNVSTAAQELAEYNWIYAVPPGGNCVDSATTTCMATPYTNVSQVYASVDPGMFEHLMGNDPRPTYFHQSNLVGGETDGLFYGVMTPLLTEYNAYFKNMPIEQPTMGQIASILAEQAAWAGNTAVSGYIQGNLVTITNTGGATNAPLTGITGVGSAYGGTQSGWTALSSGTSKYTALVTWPAARTMTTVVTPPTIVADGTSTSTAKVTLTNDSGFPVVGDTVSLTSSDTAQKISAVTDNNDGTYTATITSSTTPGPTTITATDALTPANSTWPVMNLTGQATLTQSTGVATGVDEKLSPSSIVASGSSTSTATAKVTDAQGRTLTSEQVSFSSTDPGEKIGQVTNNNDGTYSATITSSKTLGTATITATDRTSSANVSGHATLTQTAGPAAGIELGLAPSSIVANRSSTSTATATVTDAAGHALAGEHVSFSSSDSGERLGGVTDHQNGTYTVTVTSSTTAASATITATDTSVSPSVSGRGVLTQTAKPGPALDRTGPTVGFGAGTLVRSGTTVAVQLSCPTLQSYCDGTATLKTTKGVLGAGHLHIVGGKTGTAKVTLSKTALRKLGNRASVRVVIGVSAKNKAGRRGTSSRTTTLWLVLDKTNPRVGIGAGSLTSTGGSVVVKLTCPDGQTYCDGMVTLSTVAVSGKTLMLGNSHFHIARDLAGTVKIVLSKAAMLKLGKATSVHVTLAVTARNRAGRVGTSTEKTMLNLPAAPK